MIYFTYRLKQMVDGGHQPKRDVSETHLDIGYAVKADGTMLGYSTEAIAEAFTAQDIKDFSIVEITQEQAVTRCAECGMNEPTLADGKVVDANPAYTEQRGIKYVEALEAETIKTAPELVKESA